MIHNIFLTNKHLKDINPMECGEEDCAFNFRAGPTSRQYYLLHYVFSGEGNFFTEKKTYHVAKGQIFIMHPFEVVHYHANPENPWHYCWVGFELNIDCPTLSNNSVVDIPQAEYIFDTLKNAEQMGAQKELYICGKVYELLAILEHSQSIEYSKAYEYACRAKKYMESNYANTITVKQIAEELGLNRSYFSTIFSRYFQKSPQQYLTDLRLSHAAELIANYNYSITDAAINSGYNDIFNFSKMFKAKYGVAPMHYKKKQILAENHPQGFEDF